MVLVIHSLTKDNKCPECGCLPKLSSLEPNHKSMKYFCGLHISCGDWKETEELAAIDWNKRVKAYEYYLVAVETPGTDEWLYKQSFITAHVYCEDCDYEIDRMPMKDLIFKLSMEGGYIIRDKSGIYSSQCPKCSSTNLTLESD